MKAGTQNKVKFKNLQRRLGLTLWQTTGLLEQLWHITIANAIQGDIGRLSNDEIAGALEWQGDSDQLITALVECGWLDECSNSRLIVHDWKDHAPTFVKGNLAKHNKTFASKVAKQGAKQPLEEPAKQGAKHTCSEALQVATYPSQANPSQSKSSLSIGEPPKEKRFTPPTEAEVSGYCRERGNAVDASAFVDHYEAKGWMIGKNKMKDWRAAVRTWEKSGHVAPARSNGYDPNHKPRLPTPEEDAAWTPY